MSATWDQDSVIAAMQDWAEANNDVPPSMLDWTPSLARLCGYESRADRFEQHGCWPSSRDVSRLFGSWNAAIAEAGFVPMRRGNARIRGEDDIYWSRERLIDAVRQWVDLVGEPPVPSDWNRHYQRAKGDEEGLRRQESGWWPSTTTVAAAFSSFDDLVRAAGYEPITPALIAAGYDTDRWTREIVIDAIRRFAAVHDRAPTAVEALQLSARRVERGTAEARSEELLVLPSWRIVTRFFSSWNEAVSIAGCTPRSPGESRRWGSSEDPYWSRDRIVSRIREWEQEHGAPPTSNEWNAPRNERWPCASTVVRRFGSFSGALQEAGFRARTGPYDITWTRDTIIDSIREWVERHGTAPRDADWCRPIDPEAGISTHGTQRQPWPSPTSVRRTFTTWPDAMRAAGVANERADWNEATIADAMLEWRDLHGRWPRQADWHSLASSDRASIGQSRHGTQRQPWPGSATVYRTYGPWRAAILAASQRLADADT